MPDLGRIEILVLDVDGILTDGTLLVGDDGTVFKRYAVSDGAGLKYLLGAGLKAAVISGHDSDAVRHRFERLGLTDVLVGVREKLPVFREMLARHGLDASRAAAMGDDLMDLPMLREAGFSATVPDAHPRVRAVADYVTARPAGRGAVREVIEKILESRGLWAPFLEGGLP